MVARRHPPSPETLYRAADLFAVDVVKPYRARAPGDFVRLAEPAGGMPFAGAVAVADALQDAGLRIREREQPKQT